MAKDIVPHDPVNESTTAAMIFYAVHIEDMSPYAAVRFPQLARIFNLSHDAAIEAGVKLFLTGEVTIGRSSHDVADTRCFTLLSEAIPSGFHPKLRLVPL